MLGCNLLNFSKIHEALGLNRALTIKGFGSVSTGAAPIAPSTLSLLKGIGVIPLELYGCSETSGPTAANTRSRCSGESSLFYLPKFTNIVTLQTP